MKNAKLMTYKDYSKLNHPIPYTFHVKKNGQHIFYFGCRHSFDPTDSQFKEIDDFWKKFLQMTKRKNCVVLVEGGKRETADAKEKSILEGGEMHYISYLAKRNGIETFSPEPAAHFRYKKLLDKFSKEEISYYDFALVCHQWNKQKNKPDFKKYVGKFLIASAKEAGWKDFDFSLKHMLNIHTKMFDTKFDENDGVFLRSILNPMNKKSRINALSSFEESGLRDVYIMKEIKKFWKAGKNIFLMYGVSHAVRQEKFVREMVLAK